MDDHTIDGTADVYEGAAGYSSRQCAQKCGLDAKCKSFVFHRAKGYCELWSKTKECGCFERAVGYLLYFKSGDQVPPDPSSVWRACSDKFVHAVAPRIDRRAFCTPQTPRGAP